MMAAATGLELESEVRQSNSLRVGNKIEFNKKLELVPFLLQKQAF